MSNCYRAFPIPSPPSTSGSPAASAGVQASRFPMSNFYRAFSLCRRRRPRGCQRHRRECSYRDSRCIAAIGLSRFYDHRGHRARQRHRRGCRYRDPRCHAAIGPSYSAVAVDLGSCQRHRRECRRCSSRCQAAIAVCRRGSMQHLSNRSRSRPSWVMQAPMPSTSGPVGGIGGNTVLAIPDVKLLSELFTLPSPLTSGMRAASAGMPAS